MEARCYCRVIFADRCFAGMSWLRRGKVQCQFTLAGPFTVAILPLFPAPADGLTRYSINKEMHGDLEATTKGEMFSGGDPKQGGRRLCRYRSRNR